MVDSLDKKSKAELVAEVKRLQNRLSRSQQLSRRYKDLKENLRRSQEKMWQLTDLLPNSVFETDIAGKVVFANAAGLEVFGRNADDLNAGFSAYDVIAPEEHERLKVAVRHILLGEKRPPTPYVGMKKDGTRIPVVIQASRVIDGGKTIGMRGVILDITRIQQANELIQKAKKELELTVEERSRELELTGAKLSRVLEETITALSSAIEKRDPYTWGHQARVAALAKAIALELGLSRDQIKGIYMAALVHDIGKIYIPAEILSKPARLNHIEQEIIRMHPSVGFEILSAIEFPWPISRMVLQHHERLDGTGYPGGLKDADILPESKILAVSDVVEAMASHRPYRPSLGIDKALAEIESNQGKIYDTAVVRACLRLFQKKAFAF